MHYLFYFFFFFFFFAFLWFPVVARDSGCRCVRVRSGMLLSSLSSSVLSPMTSSKVTGRFRLFCDCVCLLKNVAMCIFCLGALRVFLILLWAVLTALLLSLPETSSAWSELSSLRMSSCHSSHAAFASSFVDLVVVGCVFVPEPVPASCWCLVGGLLL